MDELRGVKRGLVRVGASTTIATYLLPEAIVGFRQTHPGVQVRLEVSRSAAIGRQMETGALDVGFVEAPIESKSLHVTAFHSDELVAIARPDHALAQKGGITARQLCAQAFVVRDTGSDTKSFVERELATRGLN